MDQTELSNLKLLLDKLEEEVEKNTPNSYESQAIKMHTREIKAMIRKVASRHRGNIDTITT